MTAHAQNARTAILDAAERLFAELGYSATTIKGIAAESRQNSALIYYYFDNKETLYRHVLARVIGGIAEEAAKRAKPDASPEDLIQAVIESQVAVLAQRPRLQLLLTRELVDWKAAHAEAGIRALAATLFTRLIAAIEAGQRDGRFRSDLDPRFAAVSVIAQVAYILLGRPVAGILFGRGAEGPTPEDIRAFGRHAVHFALAALRRPSAFLADVPSGTTSVSAVPPDPPPPGNHHP